VNWKMPFQNMRMNWSLAKPWAIRSAVPLHTVKSVNASVNQEISKRPSNISDTTSSWRQKTVSCKKSNVRLQPLGGHICIRRKLYGTEINPAAPYRRLNQHFLGVWLFVQSYNQVLTQKITCR